MPGPFSPALAPALAIIGGLLAALGGLGTWVRATRMPAGGADPLHVDAVVGRSEAGGWALLVLGVAAVAAGAGWLASRPELRRAAGWVTAMVLVVATAQLVAIDRRSAELVAAARGDPAFDAYHAGFGWGAWLLLLAAVVSALALLAGWLDGVDRRRNR